MAPNPAQDLAGHQLAVVGLGLSGRAAVRLAVARGAEVLAVDTRPGPVSASALGLPAGVRLWRGALTDAPWGHLNPGDRVVVSPGVSPREPSLAALQTRGVSLVGEPGFAAEVLAGPVVGITGTNGKSTVTSWTGALLQALGVTVFTGGNLGTPLSEAVLDADGRLRATPHDAYVVELSSYQLELAGALHVRVGCVLNLTPDHLARHGTMAEYARCKAKIAAAQVAGDVLLLAGASTELDAALVGVGQGDRLRWQPGPPGDTSSGVWREHGQGYARWRQQEFTVRTDAVPVAGEVNRDHVLTATTLVWALAQVVPSLQAGDRSLADALRSPQLQVAVDALRPLPHRMQPVGTFGGVRWINDSKATNLDATRAAVRGMSQASVVLLGGEAKGPGFGALAPDLLRHRAVVAFGAAADQIVSELAAEGLTARRAHSMESALALAAELAQSGDAVLLSPAAASFDAFSSFAARGEAFANWVTQHAGAHHG